MALTVLTIDDEIAITNLIRAHLTIAGFDVVSAGSVAEALPILQTRRLDVILLDLLLPDVDGYSVFELVRAGVGTKSIPIIVVSGCQLEDAELLARQLGASDYVTKPFHPADLIDRVCRVLGPRCNGVAVMGES